MPADWRRTPILIVSDIYEHGTFLRRLLTGLGFAAVDRGDDSEVILKRLRTRKFGLVVSDARAASWAGIPLLKTIRTVQQRHTPPFILISHDADRTSIVAAKEVGMTGYLLKPFSTATLERTVTAALASAADDADGADPTGFGAPVDIPPWP